MMQIIIGHAFMDLDCLGSMVLLSYLYPKSQLIRSNKFHPVAQKMHTLFKHTLRMKFIKDIREEKIDYITIADTRKMARVGEILRELPDFNGKYEIWDHHIDTECDFPDARIYEKPYGANATLVCEKIMKKGITLNPDHATIALAGIYADTGNFTHDNISIKDFYAAAFLVEQGANLKLIREVISSLASGVQYELFHTLLSDISHFPLAGHNIAVTRLTLPDQEAGLAEIIDRIFELERVDAFFAIFYFSKKKHTLLIGRSATPDIPINNILTAFGGGGHEGAGSAFIKDKDIDSIYNELISALNKIITPALTAADIMLTTLIAIDEQARCKDALILMEKSDHPGLCAITDEGILTGIITTDDMVKALKLGKEDVPVKAFMNKKTFPVGKEASLAELQDIMYKENPPFIPVIDNLKVCGIVTRDLLLTQHMQK